MRTLLLLFLTGHGLLHLLGFGAAVGYSPGDFTTFIPRSWGLGWLAVAAILLLAALLLVLRRRHWRTVATVGIVLSQVLIFRFWTDAAFGAIANLILAVGLLLSQAAWTFDRQARRARNRMLLVDDASDLEAERDLPPLVNRWLSRSGAEHHRAAYLCLEQQLAIKLKPEQTEWYAAEADQLILSSRPAFHWSVRVRLNPLVEVFGTDTLDSGGASLRMSLFGLLTVSAVSQNEKANEAALQRYLAELAWFPAAARSSRIEWEEMDSERARATVYGGEQSASGIFTFTPQGDFLRFEAQRYREHGPEAKREPWIAEADRWTTFEGVRVPSRLRASWMLDGEKWTWLRITVTNLRHGTTTARNRQPDVQFHE
ncbi:DUF6920 family protein [Lewinella sp. IMCC34191]|uniref:DUF6920 family protein n=1 Tax=Lewinella sp. IMCC34191 TaxID=2259172 RepID=UPI000E2620E8|nr:DUF6544 family protein [Lewinella sp. IMCC34191]